MGGHATGETSLGASSIVWEVSEAGRNSAPMNSNQVLETIAAGRIGFASKIRRAPDGAWANTVEQGEFGYAFPYVNLPAGKLKRGQASPVGFIAVNPDVGRALDVARELALDPKARNLNFFCSAYLDWTSAPIIRRSRLFQMWDGFWIAPIAESTKAKPGGWLNLYLFALNLKDKEQQRTLRASGSPVAEGMRGNLSFSIPELGDPARVRPGGSAVRIPQDYVPDAERGRTGSDGGRSRGADPGLVRIRARLEWL